MGIYQEENSAEEWYAVGYFKEVQLSQLFSTENNLLTLVLSRELLVLELSYSRTPFYIVD